MNVNKIIAGILSCTTAFSVSALNNTQSTISAESYYIVGDANEDNKLTVSDAAFIARSLAKREFIDVDKVPSADYNRDGKVTVSDAAGIARFCAASYGSDTPVTTDVITQPSAETTTTATSTVTTPQTTETTAVQTTANTTTTTETAATETTTQTTTTTAVTTVTETVSETTTPHVHNYVTETEIVEHEAEYETKTIWCYIPNYFTGNQWMEDANVRASDRYVPESGLGWYSRITDYDLVTWYYGDGTWDSIAKYKDLAPWNDVNSEFYIDTEYFKNSEFFDSYIDKNNFTEYGLTEEQWYDVNYMQKKMLPAGIDTLGREMTGKIGTFDRWGNKNPIFNPELDVVINISTMATYQPIEADDGLDSKESNYESILDRYMPVAQEKFLVNDAWTEIITHEVCECGHTKE